MRVANLMRKYLKEGNPLPLTPEQMVDALKLTYGNCKLIDKAFNDPEADGPDTWSVYVRIKGNSKTPYEWDEEFEGWIDTDNTGSGMIERDSGLSVGPMGAI